MLLGVLRMPMPDDPDPLTLRQFVDRARQAADRIEADAAKLEQIAGLEKDAARLHGFAEAIMESWPDGGVDGEVLEDIAIAHGLLELKTPAPTEPCSEACACAEYYSPDEWAEGIECYRRTSLLTGKAPAHQEEPQS